MPTTLMKEIIIRSKTILIQVCFHFAIDLVCSTNFLNHLFEQEMWMLHTTMADILRTTMVNMRSAQKLLRNMNKTLGQMETAAVSAMAAASQMEIIWIQKRIIETCITRISTAEAIPNFLRHIKRATAGPVISKALRLVSVMVAIRVDRISSKVSVRAAAMRAHPSMATNIQAAAAVGANRAAKTRTAAETSIRIRIHSVPAKIVKTVTAASINKVRALDPGPDQAHRFWATIRSRAILEVMAIPEEFSHTFTVITNFSTTAGQFNRMR